MELRVLTRDATKVASGNGGLPLRELAYKGERKRLRDLTYVLELVYFSLLFLKFI